MQAQRSVQLISVRIIALAIALLAALLLASAAGYVIRGGGPVASPPRVPTTLHFRQQTDNQMEREHDATSSNLTSPFGVGH